MTQKWGVYQPGTDWNLPLRRAAYNAYTERGLSNLSTDVLTLFNYNSGIPTMFGRTLLETDRKRFEGNFEPVCKYIAENKLKAIIVFENEPLNRQKIANTDLATYIRLASYAKPICDNYGLPMGQGSIMMPAFIAMYLRDLPTKEARQIRSYFTGRGFNVGTPDTADDNRQLADYCTANGIRNGFHWQEEYEWLPEIAGTVIKKHGGAWDPNEWAIRSHRSDAGNIIGIVRAAQSIGTENNIFYNMDLGKNAVEMNEGEKKVFLDMM